MNIGRVVRAAKAEGVKGSRPTPLLGRGLLERGGGRFEGDEQFGAPTSSLLPVPPVSGMLLLRARCCWVLLDVAAGASASGKYDDRVLFSGSAAFPTILTHTRGLRAVCHLEVQSGKQESEARVAKK